MSNIDPDQLRQRAKEIASGDGDLADLAVIVAEICLAVRTNRENRQPNMLEKLNENTSIISPDPSPI